MAAIGVECLTAPMFEVFGDETPLALASFIAGFLVLRMARFVAPHLFLRAQFANRSSKVPDSQLSLEQTFAAEVAAFRQSLLHEACHHSNEGSITRPHNVIRADTMSGVQQDL
mmetsp:Transcript_3005/g.5038  ORF Transcript_3005/g.5038 Transcript_3005/m.5038 type:complete len:113 (+) Transcript_3005:147-485(+)|eukprot:CAMPEP_0169153016 /NCGR_PEP_ID=MMETSP1015-20121227/51859_1 /TAXON_ID=342587 /ORGANISM="Karlodinium micrum, Strain CCMP2283" /LENGTH=112 /DNA_ID=CAMNT_0009222923 /DNA_START=137 /DNA_END=475 /DNA_ORIENTATION=+